MTEIKLPTPFRTAFRFALILLLVTITLELSKYFMGWGNSGSSDEGAIYLIYTLTFAISIAVVMMMLKTHRDKDLGGFILHQRAIVLAFWMGLFYGVLAVIWNFIFRNFIAKETMSGENVLEANSFYIFLSSLITIVLLGGVLGIFVKREHPQV
jgi:H+/Cl- antiporter ClcA